MNDMPSQIGRYRIERLLGSGSMGHVYLAHDADLDRQVAVKTLRDVDLDEETRAVFISRFKNEARAAARLHHPNIVQIFDVGDDPTQGPYLVFEYVAGPTLKEVLRKEGPLNQERLLSVSHQIADALVTAHVAGVIHRDLKPENLLVTDNGQIKLADFGIARVPNADLTKEGQFLGTPCYAAPETLLKGEYSEKTDLFSFGAVLYEAACGERAFPGSEALVVANNVMYKDPKPPSEANRGATIPTQVDEVILRSLRKDPGARFTSARALVCALRDAYVGKAPHAVNRRRKRWTLAILATAAALATWAVFVGDEEISARPPGESPDVEPAAVNVGTGGEESATPVTKLDAGTEPDSGLSALSPHEREEAAKDHLARARAAIELGDAADAKASLDLADQYDPSNPDIAALRIQADQISP
ncbi:MAG: serine/threonine-protein kinase [Polyangiales bacterium]